MAAGRAQINWSGDASRVVRGDQPVWLTLIVVCCVLELAIAQFQAIWPTDRLLPGERIGGVDLSGCTVDQAVSRLTAAYGQYPIQVTTMSGQLLFQVPLDQPDGTTAAAAVAQVADYSWGKRLLAGSALAQLSAGANLAIHPALDAADLAQIDLQAPPQDAAIAVSGTGLIVVPPSDGWRLDDVGLLDQLNALDLSPDGPAILRVQPVVLPAGISAASATALATAITTNLGTGLTVTLGGQSTTLEPTTVLSLLSFAPAVDGTSLAASLDPAGLAAALAGLTAGIAAAPTGVNEGVSVDWVASAQAVTAALTGDGAGPGGGRTSGVQRHQLEESLGLIPQHLRWPAPGIGRPLRPTVVRGLGGGPDWPGP